MVRNIMYMYSLRGFSMCHVPTRERSTRGNRRVSLNESQFFETYPKARKAFDILARLKKGTLPFYQIR